MGRERRSDGGQAAVEYVAAIAIVTTILLGVTGVLSRELDPPQKPPLFIEAAAQPLENHNDYPTRFNVLYGLHGRPVLQGRDGEPIGRFIKAVGRQAALTARQQAALMRAFLRGVRDQVVARARLFVGDPIGQFVPELSPALIPKLIVRFAPHARIPLAVADYALDVIRHFGEPPEKIAYVLGQETGDQIVDTVIAKGKARAKAARDRALGGPPRASLTRPVTPSDASAGASASRSGARPGPAS